MKPGTNIPSRELALLKRFSRSEVKGQGHIAMPNAVLRRRHTFRWCGVRGSLVFNSINGQFISYGSLCSINNNNYASTVSAGKDMAESTPTQQRCQPTQQEVHDVEVGDGLINARVIRANVTKPSLVEEAQRKSSQVKKLSPLKHFDSAQNDALPTEGYTHIFIHRNR